MEHLEPLPTTENAKHAIATANMLYKEALTALTDDRHHFSLELEPLSNLPEEEMRRQSDNYRLDKIAHTGIYYGFNTPPSRDLLYLSIAAQTTYRLAQKTAGDACSEIRHKRQLTKRKAEYSQLEELAQEASEWETLTLVLVGTAHYQQGKGLRREDSGTINHAARDSFIRAEAILSNTQQMLEYHETPTIPESERANAIALIMNGLANTNLALGMNSYQQAGIILGSMPSLQGMRVKDAYELRDSKIREAAQLLSTALSRYTTAQKLCETATEQSIRIEFDDPHGIEPDDRNGFPFKDRDTSIFENLVNEVAAQQRRLLSIENWR